MSSAKRNQNKHLLRLSTVLADDVLIPTDASYSETMGAGFKLNISANSDTDHDLEAKDLVGTPVTLALVTEENTYRYFNGLVEELNIRPSTTQNNATDYQLLVVPWTQQLLAKRNNYRIFQDLSIPDVINQVLAEYGALAKFNIKTNATYKPWRYLTQYNETDLAFLTRLMSLVGMTYYFDHENGEHTLKIVDDASTIEKLTPDTIELHPGTAAKDSFQSWTRNSTFTVGKLEHTSHNYQQSATNLALQQETGGDVSQFANATSISSFRYSEDYTTDDEGRALLEVSAKQMQSGVHEWQGSGDVRHIQVGKNFSIALADGKAHPDDSLEFTCTHITLNASESGSLHCNTAAIEAGNLRYPVGRQPTVNGLETATVVGKSGEEIQTDESGRVKVQFHWDRSGISDGKNTCFLRVMQGFASGGFGMQFTPRVGDEVVVAYENGNPHRPFIIGSVYNSRNPVPYGDHSGLRSGIRTRSSKNGAPDNCNELYFHDEKGKEEVYFQSEKDYNQHVKNDSTAKIDNNKAVQVLKNETQKVGENLTTEVGKKILVDAGDQITIQVGSSVIKITDSKIDISSKKVVINGNKVSIN